MWLEDIERLKQQARKLEADFAAAQAGLDEAGEALERLYRSSETFGERMRKNDMEQERLRQESGGLDGRIGEEESAVAVLQTTVSHNEETIRGIAEELSSQSGRRAELEEQLRQKQGRIREIAEQSAAVEEELSAAFGEGPPAAERAGSAAQEAEQLRGKEALAAAAAARRRRSSRPSPRPLWRWPSGGKPWRRRWRRPAGSWRRRDRRQSSAAAAWRTPRRRPSPPPM